MNFQSFFALLMLTFCMGFSAQADEPMKLPNIVLIISDDQGWADIGYNNPKVYSPNFDKLASTGMIFKQHYVMPQCTPTRVALMTGRYPSRFGGAALSASNAPAFPKGTPTLSAMLKKAGYDTYLCGKWHLGSSFEHGPDQFGFDHSYGSMTGAIGMYDHRYRKGKFNEAWHRDLKPTKNHENGKHATDLITDEVVKIITSKREQPFFAYVPFHSVHTPLDERGKFVDRPTQLDPKNKQRWLNEDEIEWFNDPKGLIQKEKDPEKRLFLASVHHLDDCIGRIVKALDDSGKRENTLILFSSDNGPQVNWGGNAYPDDLKLTNFNQKLPFRGKKVDVWEGGIHVPAFANWPAKIKPTEFDGQTHIVDWYPTLAKLVGQNETVDFDGIDLSNSIFQGEPIKQRELYWTWANPVNRWALRYGDWKIVKYGKGQPKIPEDWQLFNLKTDPAEKQNVAKDNPEPLAQMHMRFLVQRSKDRQPVKKQKKNKNKEVKKESHFKTR